MNILTCFSLQEKKQSSNSRTGFTLDSSSVLIRFFSRRKKRVRRDRHDHYNPPYRFHTPYIFICSSEEGHGGALSSGIHVVRLLEGSWDCNSKDHLFLDNELMCFVFRTNKNPHKHETQPDERLAELLSPSTVFQLL